MAFYKCNNAIPSSSSGQVVIIDGTEIKELREKYSGKDRRKAFARFEEIQKQRPGIEAIKDIEKRSWEK